MTRNLQICIEMLVSILFLHSGKSVFELGRGVHCKLQLLAAGIYLVSSLLSLAQEDNIPR